MVWCNTHVGSQPFLKQIWPVLLQIPNDAMADQADLIHIKELKALGRPKHFHPSSVVRVPGPYELFADTLW